MKLIPLKGGAEHDGLPKCSKKYHGWVAGERKKIKRLYNKRVRRSEL